MRDCYQDVRVYSRQYRHGLYSGGIVIEMLEFTVDNIVMVCTLEGWLSRC